MVDVRGDVLRPPHCTTPAAVKSNKKSEMRSSLSPRPVGQSGPNFLGSISDMRERLREILLDRWDQHSGFHGNQKLQ